MAAAGGVGGEAPDGGSPDSGTAPAGPPDRAPVRTLAWSVQPWRREPARAAAALVILVVSAAGSWWFSGEWFFGLLAVVILWGSIGSFFVTSRFVMDGEGIAIDSPFLKRRRRWEEIKSWYVDRHGATLSPFAGKSWLESYRSIRVLFGDREDEVRRILNEKLGEPTRP